MNPSKSGIDGDVPRIGQWCLPDHDGGFYFSGDAGGFVTGPGKAYVLNIDEAEIAFDKILHLMRLLCYVSTIGHDHKE